MIIQSADKYNAVHVDTTMEQVTSRITEQLQIISNDAIQKKINHCHNIELEYNILDEKTLDNTAEWTANSDNDEPNDSCARQCSDDDSESSGDDKSSDENDDDISDDDESDKSSIPFNLYL